MAYNRVQVRAFLSTSERDLFESSLGASCKALGTADLRRRVQRTRTLRDKERDLFQRQRLATRARTGTKVGASGVANERTQKKATAFEEALKRFEAEMATRAGASKAPPSTGRSTTKAAAPKKDAAVEVAQAGNAVQKKSVAVKSAMKSRARPAATVLREALDKKLAALAGSASGPKVPAHDEASGGVQATGPAARGRAVSSRLADSNLSHIQGHTSTQVRRSQAKRDHKG